MRTKINFPENDIVLINLPELLHLTKLSGRSLK